MSENSSSEASHSQVGVLVLSGDATVVSGVLGSVGSSVSIKNGPMCTVSPRLSSSSTARM